jgi:hypothetical protein
VLIIPKARVMDVSSDTIIIVSQAFAGGGSCK